MTDVKTRLGNYDLLRIIAAVAVVLIHVNAHYFETISDSAYSFAEIANVLTRFSVPCFVMLSGAFSLHNSKNENFKYFYVKTFYKTVLPFLIVLVFLLMISLVKAILTKADISEPFKMIAIGDYFNLWYMFMLCGLYFFTPIVVMVKKRIPNKAFCIVSFIWLAFSVYFQTYTSYMISYSFGMVFAYMGYYLVGNVIYENYRKMKRWYLYLIVSIVCFGFAVFLRHTFRIHLYSYNQFIVFFSPLVTNGSVFLFLAFSNIRINVSFGILPKLTFYIYLFHSPVIQIVYLILKKRIIMNVPVTILLITLLVTIVSGVISVVYLKIWSILERRFRWKEKYDSFFKMEPPLLTMIPHGSD